MWNRRVEDEEDRRERGRVEKKKIVREKKMKSRGDEEKEKARRREGRVERKQKII